MINKIRTKEVFGYEFSSLKKWSRSKIVLTCDYCQKEYQCGRDYLNFSHKIIAKDCCINCCHQKICEVNLLKYGSKCTLTTSAAKEKRAKTWQTKYGTSHPFGNKTVQEKIKKTNLERYGVENAGASEQSQEKVKQTSLERYGIDNYGRTQESKDKAILTRTLSGNIKYYQGKGMQEWAEELGLAYTSFTQRVQKFGFEEAIRENKQFSSLETKMKEFLNSLNIQFHQSYPVEKKIADFYIPSTNLIIECDGLFWHSDYIIKNNKYHSEKKAIYSKNGLKSLFFREDEIVNQFDIVKSIIKNKLKMCTKVFARKCECVELDKRIGKKFIIENHLMGAGKGRIFGLTYNGNIVAVMQVKCIKDNRFEISRFCIKNELSITGGFSKLLKFVESNINMSELVTFVDRRYGEGSYLAGLGFVKHKQYLSFRWATKEKTFHRMKYPNDTGYDYGLNKVWDCGQLRWIKSYP